METPQMTSSSYASTSLDLNRLMAANAVGSQLGQSNGIARALHFLDDEKRPQVL